MADIDTAASLHPITDGDRHASSLSPRAWTTLAVMLTGTFMTVMDVFIVNVAIPSIRQTLDASFAQVQWVVAGYGLAYAVALITGGRLGDIHGRRRMFMWGLASFTLSSTLCGLAPNPHALIAARVLQGLSAALLFPQVLSLIRITFSEPRQRATAFAALGVVIGMACIAGQLLGGLLVAADLWGLEWRPVFLINLPLGLAAFVAAPALIAESRAPEGAARIDGAGVLLITLGLALLLYPLIEGREAGWPVHSLAMLAASVPVLALFVMQQRARLRRGAAVLVDMRLFKDRVFTRGLGIVLLFYSTLNASYLAFALLVQIGLHSTPLQAGLMLVCNAATFMVTSMFAGRLPAHRKDSALRLGAVIAALACLLAAVVAHWATPLRATELVPILALWGIGQGLLTTPLMNSILSQVADHHTGAAAGVLSTAQQVGGGLGVAVVGMVFFATLEYARGIGVGNAKAYSDAYAAAALYGAIATLAVWWLLRGLRRQH
jgi:EmrB/QacA subfamily drug resistance transporter